MLLLDPGLHLGVADVGVRVGQDVHSQPALGFEREGACSERLASGLDLHRKRCLCAGVGDLDLHILHAIVELKIRRRNGADLQAGTNILTDVHNGQPGRLAELAFSLPQSWSDLELGDDCSAGRCWLDAFGRAKLEAVVKQPASRQRRDGQDVRALLEFVGRERESQPSVLRLAEPARDRGIPAARGKALPALMTVEQD